MMNGVVKWIKPEMGYGVIEAQDSSYMFYMVSVQGNFNVGDVVEFEPIMNSRYPQADKVKKVGA